MRDDVDQRLRELHSRLMRRIAETTEPLAGTTAERPSLGNLPVGRSFFDTTLGRPVWWDGADWVDATGTVV